MCSDLLLSFHVAHVAHHFYITLPSVKKCSHRWRNLFLCVSPSDTCEEQTGIQRTISAPFLTSTHRGGTAEHTTPSDLFKDSDTRPGVHSRLQDTRPAGTKSCLANHSKEQVRKKNQTAYSSFALFFNITCPMLTCSTCLLL